MAVLHDFNPEPVFPEPPTLQTSSRDLDLRAKGTFVTDEIIARRVFKVDRCDAECRFFKPVEDHGSFFCRYEIDWPEGMKSKRISGVDEVQALLLGMMTAHTDLLAARNIDGRDVEWRDERSLGLPVTPIVRDWDPDNNM